MGERGEGRWGVEESGGMTEEAGGMAKEVRCMAGETGGMVRRDWVHGRRDHGAFAMKLS